LGHHRLSRRDRSDAAHGRLQQYLHHHVHDSHPAQDAVLYRQPHHSVRPHLVPQRRRLLPAVRCGRKDDHVHIGAARAGRVPATGVQNPPADIGYDPTHRQLPAVHVRQQRGGHRVYGRHHQLVLPDAPDSSDARLDPRPLPQLPAASYSDEATAARRALGQEGLHDTARGCRRRRSCCRWRRGQRRQETQRLDEVKDETAGRSSSSERLQTPARGRVFGACHGDTIKPVRRAGRDGERQLCAGWGA